MTMAELEARGYHIEGGHGGAWILQVPGAGEFCCASQRIAWRTLVALVG